MSAIARPASYPPNLRAASTNTARTTKNEALQPRTCGYHLGTRRLESGSVLWLNRQLELHRLPGPQRTPLIDAGDLDLGYVPGHSTDPQQTAADPNDDVVLAEPKSGCEGAELLGPLRVEPQHAATGLQPRETSLKKVDTSGHRREVDPLRGRPALHVGDVTFQEKLEVLQ